MREIRWTTYITAFVISLLLMAVGILLGVQLTQGVNNSLADELNSLKTKTAEFELLLLLDTNNTQICPLLSEQFKSFDMETTSFGAKIDFLEKNRGKADSTVLALKREYTLMQARDFVSVKKLNSECHAGIQTLLYFYSNENCADCQKQGEIGPVLKQENPNLMIYAFDVGLKGTIAEGLKNIYGVLELPSLVVNEKTVLSGYKTKEEVAAILNQD